MFVVSRCKMPGLLSSAQWVFNRKKALFAPVGKLMARM
jgi:hypothetical protein